MIKRAFYDTVRPTLGPFTPQQVDGFERILAEAAKRKTALTPLAYILATTWWETAKEMQPIREKGGEAYLKSKKYYPWVGEGLVQVTWEENHRKFGATQPGQLLSWPIALVALFDGMEKGMFTGRKLGEFVGDGKADYKGARKVVNGTDKAATIAGLALVFEKALREARWGSYDPIPAPEPVPVPPIPHSGKPSIQVVMTWVIGALVALIAAWLGFK